MTITTGRRAEDVAAKFLEQRGMNIIAKNVSYPFGELDLVALDKKTVIFVEVKYRQTVAYGFPVEAVGFRKQQKIVRAAQAFLKRFRVLPACRFDVVALMGDLSNPVIEHIEDAFWAEDA